MNKSFNKKRRSPHFNSQFHKKEAKQPCLEIYEKFILLYYSPDGRESDRIQRNGFSVFYPPQEVENI